MRRNQNFEIVSVVSNSSLSSVELMSTMLFFKGNKEKKTRNLDFRALIDVTSRALSDWLLDRVIGAGRGRSRF